MHAWFSVTKGNGRKLATCCITNMGQSALTKREKQLQFKTSNITRDYCTINRGKAKSSCSKSSHENIHTSLAKNAAVP